ncbi:MAG: anti-sigma factor [Ilumatobacteraceae bacterium]
MTPDRIDELIALATLGELTPADEAELSAAAAADPELASELDEALASAAALQRLHAEEPPPSLRAGVLAAIAATPQEQVDAPLDTTEPTFAPPVSLDAERTRRRRWGPLLAAAAAVVVVVAGGALLITNDDASAPDQFAAILEADDADSHTLAGPLPGTLTVTYSDSHNAMVVSGSGIPVLSDQEVYQLWVDIDGHMTPSGFFRPDADGNVEELIDGVVTTGESINVTEEPGVGAESPTLPVLATTT